MESIARIIKICAFVGIFALTGCKEWNALVKGVTFKPTPGLRQKYQVQELVSGDDLVCAVMANRDLRCFGSNAQGELGQPLVGYPRIAPPITAVQVDRSVSCFLQNKTWNCVGLGAKRFNLLRDQMREKSLSSDATRVRLRNGVFCGIDKNTVNCIGLTPFRSQGWADFGSGKDYQCGLDLGGKLYCSGKIRERAVSPAAPLDIEPLVQVSFGEEFVCGLTRVDRKVICFGLPWIKSWQVVMTDGASSLQLRGFKKIAVNGRRVCGISDRSEVFCTGELNASWVKPSSGDAQKWIALRDEQGRVFDQVQEIDLSPDHLCGVRLNGPFCVGVLKDDAFGDRKFAPVQASLVQKVELYEKSLCVDLSTGKRQCWGLASQKSVPLLNCQRKQAQNSIPGILCRGVDIDDVISFSEYDDRVCTTHSDQRIRCRQISLTSELKDIRVFEIPKDFQVQSISTGKHHVCIADPQKTSVYCATQERFVDYSL